MNDKLTMKRKPRRANVNGTRNVLTVSGKEPGYQYRVVNDVGDRIAQFEEMGYEVVLDSKVTVGDRRVANPTKEGSPVQASVGGGMKGYVMRIRDEFYQEDRAAKDKHVDNIERGMIKEAREGADYGKVSVGAN
jgi:hypothetical protein